MEQKDQGATPGEKCINCAKWVSDENSSNMNRMGFAKCEAKRLPGHMMSANAPACDKLNPIDQADLEKRATWLKKAEVKWIS